MSDTGQINHRLRTALGLAALLMLAGCASQGRYALDISLSEASEMATRAAAEERTISAPWPSFWSRSSVEVQTGPVALQGQDHNGCAWPGCAESRLVIGRRYGIDFGPNQYRLQDGYQLHYGLREQQVMYRFGIFGHPAAFYGAAGEGKHAPFVFGIDMAALWLPALDNGPFSLALGGQISSGILAFAFDNPLLINGEAVAGDALGFLGLGIPMGLIYDQGAFTLEALVTPTLAFHDDYTDVGFYNDVFSVHRSVPVSLGLGVCW